MITLRPAKPSVWWWVILPSLPYLAGILLARVSMGCKWQFRVQVFQRCVLGAIAADTHRAIATLAGAWMAHFIIIFSIPRRVSLWATAPFLRPFQQKDPKFWTDVAEMLSRAEKIERAFRILKDARRWTS